MNEILCIIEAQADEVERGLLYTLAKNRQDTVALAAYGDYLEERGRLLHAEEKEIYASW